MNKLWIFLEPFQPTVESNLKNLKNLEAEINHRYDLFIKELNSNKEKLLGSLRNLKTEKYSFEFSFFHAIN